MRKLNLFLMLVMLGFGMMNVQTAEPAGGTTLSAAPCEGTTHGKATANSRPFLDNGSCDKGPQWNARIAIAPYAQVVAGNSYTFIGISHPSLATAHTSIGVVVEALNMTTVPDTKVGRAAVFTISAGETHRVFVVNQGHSTINLNNSAFTDSQTHLITTSDASQFGNIKVWSVGTEPTYASNAINRPGGYREHTAEGSYAHTAGIIRFDNLNQLAMWGVVYQTANGAGFALEFIGDMHDSTSIGCVDFSPGGSANITPQCGSHYSATGRSHNLTNSSGAGRGIN